MAELDARESWADRCARWEALVEALETERDDLRREVEALWETVGLANAKRLAAVVVERDTQIAALRDEIERLRPAAEMFDEAMTAGLNTAIEEMARWDAEAADTQIAALKAALQGLFDATAVLDGWEGCDNVPLADEPWEPCGECVGCAITAAVEARNVADDFLAAVSSPGATEAGEP